MIFQPAVIHAATVGAREAGKGADISEIVACVDGVLAPHCITISDTAGSGTKVILEEGLGPVTTEFGDPNLTCDLPANALLTDEVRVTVCIHFSAVPMCDALAPFGFSLADKRFEASSLVKVE